MRVFLDTNVIVSAVTTRGLCADVFRTVLAEPHLITSSRVLEEVRRFLKSKFAVPVELIEEYIEFLVQDAILAEPKDTPALRIKDKDDTEIVAAAVNASAHVLVTGDREMQGIKTVRKVRVVSPRAFWEKLTANKAL